MSARLAYSLLGRSKYHIAEGAPGGSARHAAASLGESQRSSQDGGGFSQQSALDEGGHLSARRGGGESARRGGSESARRGGGSAHAFKALPLLSPSVSKFGGGGGGTDSARAGLDHTVLKRIVEQEARLAEQAALIKRLEAKLDCALDANGRIRAEVSHMSTHMPQKICEQLHEQLTEQHAATASAQEERSHALMHSFVQKLEQSLTQQMQLQLQSALSIRAAAADVAAGGALHRSDGPSPLPPPPPRPPQRLETPAPRHRPSKHSPDASSSAFDCQDSRSRDDAGTSPHFATRKRKLSMLGQAAEGRDEDEQQDDDEDNDEDVTSPAHRPARGNPFDLFAEDDGAPHATAARIFGPSVTPAPTRAPPPRAAAAAAAAVAAAAAAGGGVGVEVKQEYPSSGASSHYTPLSAAGGGVGVEVKQEYPSSGASSHYTPLSALSVDVIPIARYSPSDPGLRGRLEGRFIASGGGDGSGCSGGGGGLGLLGSFGRGSGAVPNVLRALAPENSERRDSAFGQPSRRRHLQALDAEREAD